MVKIYVFIYDLNKSGRYVKNDHKLILLISKSKMTFNKKKTHKTNVSQFMKTSHEDES